MLERRNNVRQGYGSGCYARAQHLNAANKDTEAKVEIEYRSHPLNWLAPVPRHPQRLRRLTPSAPPVCKAESAPAKMDIRALLPESLTAIAAVPARNVYPPAFNFETSRR